MIGKAWLLEKPTYLVEKGHYIAAGEVGLVEAALVPEFENAPRRRSCLPRAICVASASWGLQDYVNAALGDP